MECLTEFDEKAYRKGIFEEGLEVGLETGRKERLIDQVCKKLAKGYDAKTTAEMLEEEELVIEQIYFVAERFAPEYDVQMICKELQRKHQNGDCTD